MHGSTCWIVTYSAEEDERAWCVAQARPKTLNTRPGSVENYTALGEGQQGLLRALLPNVRLRTLTDNLEVKEKKST